MNVFVSRASLMIYKLLIQQKKGKQITKTENRSKMKTEKWNINNSEVVTLSMNEAAVVGTDHDCHFYSTAI